MEFLFLLGSLFADRIQLEKAMITRFRVEGFGQTLEDCRETLTGAVSKLISTHRTQEGEWECTAEIITQKISGYQGRMVMVFHPTDPFEGDE